MIETARKLVEELMKNDDSGHGMEHINRVVDLAITFAEQEKCDKDIVALGALLHDVDDYKLFGVESQNNLTNTNIILDKLNLDEDIKNSVLDIVSKIGYSKYLNGIRPNTIEGMIVSDADMCDAIGVSGIIRTHKYTLKNGRVFFDKDKWPIDDIDASKYTRKVADTSVCHIFEKVLRLKNIMMTKSGKQEAILRHKFVVDFLRQLFREEKAYDWEEYLNNYLSKLG